ncbi:MAG: DUF262 domain-containing protein [Nitrososphaerota archaeon]|nr:DUF262 domain-containing protein [Nitrososphaerota archaeon]
METSFDEVVLEEIKGEKEDEEKLRRSKSKLYSYPADFTLEVLIEKLHHNEIKLPEFQRRYIWTKEKASGLIESFLLSLPVPPVYLFTRKDGTLLIIDGHQRLQSILRYFDNRWEGESGFKLDLGEESELNNKSFTDLSASDQKRLKNSVMRAVVIEPLESSDDAMYDMFQRLNTGGVLLTPQEIRNSVYHGKFNDLLLRLNLDKNWRMVFGKPTEDNRMRDVELILRGIALCHVGTKVNGDILKYRSSMKSFLNDFMEANQNADEKWLDATRLLFTRTVEQITDDLGEQPFHLRRLMNAPTYDAVFVAFARHLDKIPGDIKSRYQKLKDIRAFQELTGYRPTSETSVNGRMEIAEKVLFG